VQPRDVLSPWLRSAPDREMFSIQNQQSTLAELQRVAMLQPAEGCDHFVPIEDLN
jgi:hypothetical protein